MLNILKLSQDAKLMLRMPKSEKNLYATIERGNYERKSRNLHLESLSL